jgi:hypothetical protein
MPLYPSDGSFPHRRSKDKHAREHDQKVALEQSKLAIGFARIRVPWKSNDIFNSFAFISHSAPTAPALLPKTPCTVLLTAP